VSATSTGRRPTIDPRIRQRRVAVRRGQGRRRLRWVLAGLVVVAVVVGGLALLHTPLFNSKVVTVTGSHPHTPTAAIVSAAGLDRPVPLIDLNTGAAADRVEALPYIASAEVTRHWPDGVTIAVTERAPAAVVAGPGSSWSIVDAAGRTLLVQPTRPAGLVQLVVTTAKGQTAPVPVGASLPAVADPGLRVASTLPPAFAAQVTSVSVAPDGTVDLALNSGLTVQLGTATDLAAKYEDVAAIIAHADLHGKKVIDVTVPDAPAVG
jgi:cell division protein FtsQ